MFCFFVSYLIRRNDRVNDNYSLYVFLGYFGSFTYETIMIQYSALCCVVAYLYEPMSHV